MASLSKRKINQYEKIITPNSAYFKTLDKDTRRYLRVLCKDWPAWLDDYIATPEMKRLKFISQTCGTDYTNLYAHHSFYDVLDHSVGTALIVWNFTKDKTKTLAALFHDISTPIFKHCVDAPNNNIKNQKPTELPRIEIIKNSPKITKLLLRDKINLKDVINYNPYPVTSGNAPELSANQLEYSLMSFHKCNYKTYFSIEQIDRFYNNIEIGKKEDGTDELAFRDIKIAEDFALALAKSWSVFYDEKWRLTTDVFATIIESLFKEKLLTKEAPYHLTEHEVLTLAEKSKNEKMHKIFQKFENAKRIKKSDKKPENAVFVSKSQTTKRHYIDPLVRAEVNLSIRSGKQEIRYARLSKISPKTATAIKKLKSQKFAKYAYI